jgi:hypothetical protein
MTIKTAISSISISESDIEDIIFHFNTMKPSNFGILEKLICREGGFKIVPPEAKTVPELHKNPVMNQYEIEKRRARELRWNSGKYLVNYCNIPGFLIEEEILLFKTMRFVLGKENVEYFDTYGDAKQNSPSIIENLLVKKSPKRTLAYSPPSSTFITRICPI